MSISDNIVTKALEHKSHPASRQRVMFGTFTDEMVRIPSFKTQGCFQITKDAFQFYDDKTDPGLTHVKSLAMLVSRQRSVRFGDVTLNLQPGLTVITGTTGAGKTSLINMIGDSWSLAGGDAYVIKVDEPVEGSVDDHRVTQKTMIEQSEFYTSHVLSAGSVEGQFAQLLCASIDEATTAAVCGMAFSDNTLVMIDSLRGLLFETSGPAGSKGIVMPFFTKLTRMNNYLAAAGVCLIVTVNPMDDDVDFVRAFNLKLSASVACYIDISGSTSGSMTLKVSERPDRKPTVYHVNRDHSNNAQPVVVQSPVFNSDVELTVVEDDYPPHSSVRSSDTFTL